MECRNYKKSKLETCNLKHGAWFAMQNAWLHLPQLLRSKLSLRIMHISTWTIIAFTSKVRAIAVLLIAIVGILDFSICKNSYQVLINTDLLTLFKEIFSAYSANSNRYCQLGPLRRPQAGRPRDHSANLGKSRILLFYKACRGLG